MAYKISGNLGRSSRVIVFDESDYSIESNTTISGGDYEILGLNNSNKLVVAIADDDGESIGYGNVSPAQFSYQLPDTVESFAHYIGDNIVSSSNWPDENSNVDLVNSVGTISIVSNGVNNHDYVRLDTTAARIYSNTMAAIPTDITVGVVMRWAQASSNPNGYSWWVGPRNTGYGPHLRFNLGAGQMSVEGFNGNLCAITTTSTWNTNQWYAITIRYRAVSNWISGSYSGELRRDNSVVATTNNTPSTNTGTPIIMFGSDYEGIPDVDIAEFIYYKAGLDDDEIDSLNLYLMDKYGLL